MPADMSTSDRAAAVNRSMVAAATDPARISPAGVVPAGVVPAGVVPAVSVADRVG